MNFNYYYLELRLFKNKPAPTKPAGATPIRPTKGSTEAFRYDVSSPFLLLTLAGPVIGYKICTPKRNRPTLYTHTHTHTHTHIYIYILLFLHSTRSPLQVKQCCLGYYYCVIYFFISFVLSHIC